MKKVIIFLFLLPVSLIGKMSENTFAPIGYDNNLIYISSEVWNKKNYLFVTINREGERMNAKYFASNRYQEKTVAQRYNEWSVGKNPVLLCSGTYMNNCDGAGDPIGLCIDNGKVINKTLETDKLDALVIVYATGGIVVSDLTQGNLLITWSKTGVKEILDITNSPEDKDTFLNWATEEQATVFQTHLLIYKDIIKVYQNSSDVKRERRFLALYYDMDGKLFHSIISSDVNMTLLEGAQDIKSYLKDYSGAKQIVSLINLDRGCQDAFRVYDNTGIELTQYRGETSLDNAVNLVVYYYK